MSISLKNLPKQSLDEAPYGVSMGTGRFDKTERHSRLATRDKAQRSIFTEKKHGIGSGTGRIACGPQPSEVMGADANSEMAV
jgi:hypothetical protein